MEELYQDHDLKALSLKDLINSEEFKNTDRGELTPEQLSALEKQEEAQRKLLVQLKKERHELIAEFDSETDLKKKIIV